MSRLRAALRFGCGVVHNSGGSGITSQHMGSARPYQDVNRIYFYLGGPGSPHQQGWGPCSSLLSRLLLSATVITILIINAKVIGMVPNDSSRCWMHRASDTINSITTQRQLYLTRITVRTSGTVPGEHTVGQTRLMVQLAVGSQRNSNSDRDRPFL